MNEEKQIEEMACKNCIHYEVCMYVNAQAVEYARAENCKLFKNNAGYRKQKDGEWENVYEYNAYHMRRERKTACSICGYKPKGENKTKFCPNCGAKMKGGTK